MYFSLRKLLDSVNENCDELSAALTKRAEELVIPADIDLPFVQPVLVLDYDCFDYILASICRKARTQWKDFVNDQLGQGGGEAV